MEESTFSSEMDSPELMTVCNVWMSFGSSAADFDHITKVVFGPKVDIAESTDNGERKIHAVKALHFLKRTLLTVFVNN